MGINNPKEKGSANIAFTQRFRNPFLNSARAEKSAPGPKREVFFCFKTARASLNR